MTGSACPAFTQHLGKMVGTARCAFAHPTEFFAALLLNDRGASKRFARRANVPHPDGYCRKPQIRTIIRWSRSHKEGRFAIVTNVGSGMRWTRYRSRRMLVSRTAKSCGPGAPTLALSPQRCFGILRVTVARKPGSPGRPRISRKTIAQGRPDDFG